MNSKKYSKFIFFSAGPVGDQAIAIDTANRFFESTGISSYIIAKHPNPFLSDLVTPYKDHIEEIKVKGYKGILSLALIAVKSVYSPYCYILILGIALPWYMKLFAYFIRFCSRSRIVGLNSLSGFYLPGGPVPSAIFLGKDNYIPAQAEVLSFAEQANNMLEFLGYPKIERPPQLTYIPQESFLGKYNLVKDEYIVFHLVPSHRYRSFHPDRWNSIIKELRKALPDTTFVFSGADTDRTFVEECLRDISRENTIDLCKRTSMQELLTLYSYARLSVTVHTGNAMILNMLHVPVVVVNMKGPYMFNYFFNEKATILVSKKDCTCDPLDVKCTMIPYKGESYMACVWNIKDEEVINSILEKWNA